MLRSRPYLWRSIRLEGYEIPQEDVYKLVSHSHDWFPAGASYTETLSMSGLDMNNTLTVLSLLPSTFAALTTLSLTFSSTVIKVPKVDVLSPTVTTLAVSHVTFRTLDDWHNMVAGFPRLCNLKLGSAACILDIDEIEFRSPDIDRYELRLDSLLLHFGDWNEDLNNIDVVTGLRLWQQRESYAITTQWFHYIRSVETSTVVITGTGTPIMDWLPDVWKTCDQTVEELQLEFVRSLCTSPP